jgi:predicted permease
MIAGLRRRLREVFDAGRIDRETVDELTHHVESLVAAKMAAGLDQAEARRQARMEAGSLDAAREEVAAERSGVWLEQLRRECGYALRGLRRSPGLTALSIMTIAGGIGASAILFALVNGIVLQPLRYPHPDRLVRIFDTNISVGVQRTGTASGNIAHWRQRATVFEGIAGYYVMGRTASLADDADAVMTAQVSEDFFAVMGVAPIAGRTFTVDETRRAEFNNAAAPVGVDPVAVVSHGYWIRRLGGGADAIGRTIRVERRPFKVVGVMPAGFSAPQSDVEIWIPWHLSVESPRDQHYLGAVARLAGPVSLAEAEEHLNAIARELENEFPDTNRGWKVDLSPLAVETVGGAAAVLWVLLGAVTLVLLVACANVALLGLMRGLDRQQEVAVRLALGASSARLMREFLCESVLLALAGGALGAAITAGGLTLLPAITADLPRLDEVSFGGRAMIFIAAITVLTSILSGLPQARRGSRVNVVAGLSTASRRSIGRPQRHRLRDAIVIAQITMAVTLMTGSGLLVRSFGRLQATDPGFDPRGVLVIPVFLDNQHYTTGARTRAYYQALFDRLGALPGVIAVGGGTTVPTSPLGPDFERPVWRSDRPNDGAANVQAAVRMITPGYTRALGLTILDGRGFDDRDSPQAPRVIMISRTLAARLWPGQSAVGEQMVVDYSSAGTYPYEIVGVIDDLRFRGPRSEPLHEIYLPHAQRSYLVMNVVVKTTGDPRQLIAPVREAMRQVDAQMPPQNTVALEDLLGATYARDRQLMITLLMFAAAAIMLAVLSIYGALSQQVRERSRDIAIRVALGADRTAIIGWVARSGLRLVAGGVAIGGAIAWAAGGALQAVLFGVEPADLPTMIAVFGGVCIIGIAATLRPAWRATRIDPIEILRR